VCRFYAPDNSLVTVEQLALQHYASQEAGGWQGLHCEGGVWATLFTLLLWDVIFMGEAQAPAVDSSYT
jgi:Fanconi-associated nuclease 1